MLGNLFNWLHEHRSMKHLPDLGSTDTWEMVGTPNSYSKEFFHAGGSKSGGLAGLARGKWWNKHGHDVAFRILIDL